MQVGAGGPAGIAHPADGLAPPHGLALGHEELGGVGVQGGDPAAMVDLHRLAVGAAVAGAPHDAALCCADLGALGGSEVDAAVDGGAAVEGIGAEAERAGDARGAGEQPSGLGAPRREGSRASAPGDAELARPAEAARLRQGVGERVHEQVGVDARAGALDAEIEVL